MNYISTRGTAPELGFEDVLLTGLARDGGLYVPDAWPDLSAADIRSFAAMPYHAVATRVMAPFADGIEPDAFADIVRTTYEVFDHHSVAPLRQLGPNEWLMELFHGPTLAFKDVAMQLLARLFEHVLARRSQRLTIVGATSGDTGAAAIEAFRDRAGIDVVILHPLDRVSEVQRRQMTTVTAANVHNIAVQGTFDDCQALLKAMFNDMAFRDEIALSAINSINWARVLPQAVYYFTAAAALGGPDRPVAFCVPTGNFGDVYAGYVAAAMGLPVERLVVATNRNDILHRFFQTGEYRVGEVHATQSPSMDIQVASNFERLLFDLAGRDGATVSAHMRDLSANGGFAIEAARLANTRALFDSGRADEAETTAMIGRVHAETGLLLDPHTAVGVAAARGRTPDDTPVVVLGTAHPAKFPDAVEKATRRRPELPPRLADLYDREERYDVLPNELAAVQAHIRGLIGGQA